MVKKENGIHDRCLTGPHPLTNDILRMQSLLRSSTPTPPAPPAPPPEMDNAGAIPVTPVMPGSLPATAAAWAAVAREALWLWYSMVSWHC